MFNILLFLFSIIKLSLNHQVSKEKFLTVHNAPSDKTIYSVYDCENYFIVTAWEWANISLIFN